MRYPSSRMVSCEKNKTNNNDQLEKVKKILELEARMNAFNYGTNNTTGFMSVIGYSQFKDGQLNIESSGSEPGYPDSTSIDLLAIGHGSPVPM